jgi:hypothetical protein
MFGENKKRVIIPYDAGVQGNSKNLYYDSATGTMYYWNGTSYVPWGGSETITNITNITDGFSYTNESGVTKNVAQKLDNTDPLNQKIQTFVDGVKVFEFPLYTVNNDIQINNSGSEWDLTDDKITIKETNGDTQEINFPYRVTMVVNADGSIDVKQNGVTIGTIPAPTPDTAYSKMLFVDPVNGNDTTGTGSDNKMFKTIAKAVSVANGSGYRIVLGAGTYTENPTISLPNLDIVTVAGSDRGNTSIQGTVTFTHTSSSSGIQGISMTNLVHSGAGALYVTDCQINTLLNKTSAAYIEINNSTIQTTSTSTLSAGSGLIMDSLISNLTISGASSAYTLKSNIIDITGSVTYTGGAFYNIQDNSGNINVTAGTNLETALVAQGLPSETAKQYVTDFSTKLAMLNPDTNNSNTNLVSWNATTKRLEVSALPVGGALWYSGTNTPTATGNSAASLGVTTLPANYTNTTTGVKYYIDANGVSGIIDGRLTTSLLGRNGNGTAYVNPTMVSDTTLVDAFELSDGTFAHVGQIKYPAHGLVKHAYYFGSATAPYFTVIPPTSGILQQVFYVIDENTIDIDIEQGVTIDLADYANVVYVNNTNANNGTIYDTNNPPTTNNNALKGDVANIYIGTDGSLWIWNGTAYVTKPATNNTEWNLGGTQIDAQGNKTSAISRTGFVAIGKDVSTTIPIDVYGKGTAQYSPVARFLNETNNIVGNNTQLIYGVGQSYGNAADWRFHYAGNGNAKNRIDFAWSGIVAPSMSYLVNGNVGINMTDPLSRLDVNGSFGFNIRPADTSTSQTATDGTVVLKVAGSVYTLEAPNTTTNKRRLIVAKNVSTGNITVTGHIDGVAGTNLVIPSGGSKIFHTEGTSWYAISDNTPNAQSQVSARANRGNDVTLDNLKFRVAATGNASLQVSTVTGTATLNGTSFANTEAFGLVSALAVTTTPTYVRPALAFANAGDTQRFLFNTTDNKSYEVRLVIDPGYSSNLIHIQRLH